MQIAVMDSPEDRSIRFDYRENTRLANDELRARLVPGPISGELVVHPAAQPPAATDIACPSELFGVTLGNWQGPCAPVKITGSVALSSTLPLPERVLTHRTSSLHPATGRCIDYLRTPLRRTQFRH
jgi:hypothetical protein